MRNLGEIAHSACKISLFSWNGKFIVKFEQGPCEQTLKFDHLDFADGEKDLRARLTDDYISRIVARFDDLQAARNSLLDLP